MKELEMYKQALNIACKELFNINKEFINNCIANECTNICMQCSNNGVCATQDTTTPEYFLAKAVHNQKEIEKNKKQLTQETILLGLELIKNLADDCIKAANKHSKELEDENRNIVGK